MYNELTWREVGDRLDIPTDVLEERERTSTTKRIRRVGEFDAGQFKAACRINGPTKLFLTFADYITRKVAGVKEWGKLGVEVMAFINLLEAIADCPVVGVSTGRTQAEVAWRPGYSPGGSEGMR
jgi:adenylosuccinate synthase